MYLVQGDEPRPSTFLPLLTLLLLTPNPRCGLVPLPGGQTPFLRPQSLQGTKPTPAIPAPRPSVSSSPHPPRPLRTGTGLRLSCQWRERGCDSAGPPLASQLGRSKAGPWLEVCGSQGAPPITQVSPQIKEKTSLWVSQESARKPADLPRVPAPASQSHAT